MNPSEREKEQEDAVFFEHGHLGTWVGGLTHTTKTIPKPWYTAWMFWTKPETRQVLIDPLPSGEELLGLMLATLSESKQQQFASDPERHNRVIRRIKSSLDYHRTSSL